MVRGLFLTLPESSNSRDTHRYLIAYAAGILVAITVSATCFAVLPITGKDAQCVFFVTKADPIFIYVIIYGLQLSTAVYAFITNTVIIHLTKKHLQRITNQNLTMEAFTDSNNTLTRFEFCKPICWRYCIHLAWFVMSRIVLIIFTQLYLSELYLLESYCLNILYICTYLVMSSYPTMYVVVSKNFRQALW